MEHSTLPRSKRLGFPYSLVFGNNEKETPRHSEAGDTIANGQNSFRAGVAGQTNLASVVKSLSIVKTYLHDEFCTKSKPTIEFDVIDLICNFHLFRVHQIFGERFQVNPNNPVCSEF